MVKQNNQCTQPVHDVDLSDFIAIEFSIFAAQTLIFFIVIYFISDHLVSEDRITAFINGKINDFTMKELSLTLFSITFVIGLFALIKEITSFEWLEKLSANILFELPRTFYLFGSNIVASVLAIAFFLFSHPEATQRPATSFLAFAAYFTLVFFVFGCSLKWLFSQKRGKTK